MRCVWITRSCSRHRNMVVIFDEIGSSGGGNSAIKISFKVRAGIIIKPTNFPGHRRQWKWILISSNSRRKPSFSTKLIKRKRVEIHSWSLVVYSRCVTPFYFESSFLSLMKETWCLRCGNGKTLLPRRFQKDSYPKEYSPVFL